MAQLAFQLDQLHIDHPSCLFLCFSIDNLQNMTPLIGSLLKAVNFVRGELCKNLKVLVAAFPTDKFYSEALYSIIKLFNRFPLPFSVYIAEEETVMILTNYIQYLEGYTHI